MDLSVETHTMGSDMTGCARNVSGNLGADQEDCKLHGPALVIMYSTGSKENTRTRVETESVSSYPMMVILFVISHLSLSCTGW